MSANHSGEEEHATQGKSWPAITSMSLRNELRQPFSNLTLMQTGYNWQTWYSFMREAASTTHQANPDLLIFLSGMDSDATLKPIVQATALEPGSSHFRPDDFEGYANKLE